jgi:hypothetical protein
MSILLTLCPSADIFTLLAGFLAENPNHGSFLTRSLQSLRLVLPRRLSGFIFPAVLSGFLRKMRPQKFQNRRVKANVSLIVSFGGMRAK